MTKYAIIIHATGPKLQNNSIDEFYGLVNSAGYIPFAEIVQQVISPNPKFFIGKGKVAQIQMALFDYFGNYVEKERVKVSLEDYYNPYDPLELDFPGENLHPSDIVAIFNNNLKQGQKRELSKVWAIEVLDRDDVILSIFEQNARTRQSKLQIELARLRLMADIAKADFGAHLDEKQGRDFKGKGRMAWEPRYKAYRERRKRIIQELERIKREREIRRKRRARLFNVGIFGYTNAGKSTLVNRLTHADLETADEEFTTVTTVSRRLVIPDYDEFGNWKGEEIIITDSVGFIENMNDIIFEAFLATLEELRFSDLILIVVDISEPDLNMLFRKLKTNFYVLEQIDAHMLPKILALNKIDRIEPELLRERMEMIKDKYGEQHMVPVSAKQGDGLDKLRKLLLQMKRTIENTHPIIKSDFRI